MHSSLYLLRLHVSLSQLLSQQEQWAVNLDTNTTRYNLYEYNRGEAGYSSTVLLLTLFSFIRTILLVCCVMNVKVDFSI